MDEFSLCKELCKLLVFTTLAYSPSARQPPSTCSSFVGLKVILRKPEFCCSFADIVKHLFFVLRLHKNAVPSPFAAVSAAGRNKLYYLLMQLTPQIRMQTEIFAIPCGVTTGHTLQLLIFLHCTVS